METKLALALRYRITAVFILFLAGGLIFIGMAYKRHITIEAKLKFIEAGDDLVTNILEARRYEKNFFLYGQEENLKLMLDHLARAENQLKSLNRMMRQTIHSEAQLDRKREMLDTYRQTVLLYGEKAEAMVSGKKLIEFAKLGDRVRNLGRELTEEMIKMVKTERHITHELIAQQKLYLLLSSGAFILLSAGVACYLLFLIVLPMTKIEAAAKKIAESDFQQIPSVPGIPEIQSMITALNQMITELGKRAEHMLQTKKMAALGTLTSGVAHELNNPLSNISSSTQILLEEMDDIDPEFQKNLLTGIESQVEKARDIVRALLEFVREREFEPAPINLKALIEDTLKLVQGDIPAEVNIELDLADDLNLEVDRRRLTQALINLILNGVQAMEGTGGVLTLKAYPNPTNQTAILEVIDTGVGISDKNLAKIYDPFFTTKEVSSGNGLGLYITYGIIQQHHGKIDVTSKLGEGTKFTLTLPISQSENDHAA
ncbi:MAG: HAMP domain-containing protein [Deltaproteobacteria bacterium]|nr:HAMP domain-containing protein [Deltaproteobacteria bacterium]